MPNTSPLYFSFAWAPPPPISTPEHPLVFAVLYTEMLLKNAHAFIAAISTILGERALNKLKSDIDQKLAAPEYKPEQKLILAFATHTEGTEKENVQAGLIFLIGGLEMQSPDKKVCVLTIPRPLLEKTQHALGQMCGQK